MKKFLVTHQWAQRVVEATSPRQAIIRVMERYHDLTNPKLFKIYVDKPDGSTALVGYGCGRFWCDVAEVIPFEVRA